MKRYLTDLKVVTLETKSQTKAGGSAVVTGKFTPHGRVVELSDAQVVLYAAAIEGALSDGLLLLPKGEG